MHRVDLGREFRERAQASLSPPATERYEASNVEVFAAIGETLKFYKTALTKEGFDIQKAVKIVPIKDSDYLERGPQARKFTVRSRNYEVTLAVSPPQEFGATKDSYEIPITIAVHKGDDGKVVALIFDEKLEHFPSHMDGRLKHNGEDSARAVGYMALTLTRGMAQQDRIQIHAEKLNAAMTVAL